MKNSEKIKQTSQKQKPKRFLKAVSFSVLVGAVVTCVLMLLVSFMMTKMDIAQSLMKPIATFCYCAGGFASGYMCSILNKKNGFFMGLLCGFILFTLGVLSAIIIVPFEFSTALLVRFFAILVAAALGGTIGINKSNGF